MHQPLEDGRQREQQDAGADGKLATGHERAEIGVQAEFRVGHLPADRLH